MFKPKINPALILHFTSIVMVFESIFMLFSVFVALLYRESTASILFNTFFITFSSGLALNLITRKNRKVEPNRRESIVIVAIGWFLLGLIGAVPYLVTDAIPSFTNAFFESISGFTTTGSSILTNIEAMPKSLLFWRAETHWIGGMGIIVLVVAVMPFLNIHGISLYQSETSTAADERVAIRIRNVARTLWMIYLGLTVVEIVLLLIGKMPLFDAICHSFATVATGGFSTRNTSIEGYSPYIQYVVTLFMMLSGINFAVHVLSVKGKVRSALKNEELRLYLTLILATTIIITLILYGQGNIKFEKAFRDSAFQVVSILTATGFATTDYLAWPEQAIILIGFLMLIGACAGSTGGGVKVIRHLIALKKIRMSFQNILSPNTINLVRYNGNVVYTDNVSRIVSFIIMYYAIVAVSTLTMMVLGQDAATSFGSVVTCMGGIGPGFGTVGPVSNFYHLSDLSKYFLSFLMVLGRLELYTILVIFTTGFWRD